MKTNKWGIRISFAILGSAFLSFSICIVNYITIRKELVDHIIIETYQINNFGFSALFSQEKDLTLEKAVQVLSVIDDKYYAVYEKVSELYLGVFWYDKRRKKIKEIKSRIESDLKTIYNIESYIETYPNEAINHTKQIYNKLDKFIDDDSLYKKILNLGSNYKSNVSSLETVFDKNVLKKECADKYKETLEK